MLVIQIMIYFIYNTHHIWNTNKLLNYFPYSNLDSLEINGKYQPLIVHKVQCKRWRVWNLLGIWRLITVRLKEIKMEVFREYLKIHYLFSLKKYTITWNWKSLNWFFLHLHYFIHLLIKTHTNKIVGFVR